MDVSYKWDVVPDSLEWNECGFGSMCASPSPLVLWQDIIGLGLKLSALGWVSSPSLSTIKRKAIHPSKVVSDSSEVRSPFWSSSRAVQFRTKSHTVLGLFAFFGDKELRVIMIILASQLLKKLL